MNQLTKLELAGWKSIREASIPFGPLTVLIGANGSGKSNLLSFFKLLNEMIGERLQRHIGIQGGGDGLLYLGARQTPRMSASLEFSTDAGISRYSMRLLHAAGDALVFDHEKTANGATGRTVDLGNGHRESKLARSTKDEDQAVAFVRDRFSAFQVFHFNETSSGVPVRQKVYTEESKSLLAHGENLAAVLHLLRNFYLHSYNESVEAIRQAAPFFRDFELAPKVSDVRYVALNWRDRTSDRLFGPHQISDGTLRFMCLATLLHLPAELLPSIIIIDEPELGLHPDALHLVAAMIRQASLRTQLIVATQSPLLVDEFKPEEVVVVEGSESGSTFKRLDSTTLKDWLEDYSLGELWQKNVVGGGPFS